MGYIFQESQDADVLYLFSKPIAPSYQSLAIPSRSDPKTINTKLSCTNPPFPKKNKIAVNQPNHAYPMRRSLKRQEKMQDKSRAW